MTNVCHNQYMKKPQRHKRPKGGTSRLVIEEKQGRDLLDAMKATLPPAEYYVASHSLSAAYRLVAQLFIDNAVREVAAAKAAKEQT